MRSSLVHQYPSLFVEETTLFFVRVYRHGISPFLHALLGIPFGSCGCRFFPSCGEYAAQAIERYGFIRGLAASTKRLIRCHPWSRGGYDPVSKEISL